MCVRACVWERPCVAFQSERMCSVRAVLWVMGADWAVLVIVELVACLNQFISQRHVVYIYILQNEWLLYFVSITKSVSNQRGCDAQLFKCLIHFVIHPDIPVRVVERNRM